MVRLPAYHTPAIELDVEHRLVDAPHGAGILANHFVKGGGIRLKVMESADGFEAEPVGHREGVLRDLYAVHPDDQTAAISAKAQKRMVLAWPDIRPGAQAEIQRRPAVFCLDVPARCRF